ncbi:unnamed protein product [Amoebophrya sp. A120]|nr:unnamed protein product [Amoebophrya sp. A120]|eukprot:GSA120T00010551001.1
MRPVLVASLANVSSALMLSSSTEPAAEKEFTKVLKPETPDGIATDPDDVQDASKLVVCEDEDVPFPTKVIFSTIMGCNRGDKDPEALCDKYNSKGCDNEVCHDICHEMYSSKEHYKGCKCVSWGAEPTSFKTYSPGAPCPLKVQPRCYEGTLYRSECEAFHDNEGISAADMTVVPKDAWPGMGFSIVTSLVALMSGKIGTCNLHTIARLRMTSKIETRYNFFLRPDAQARRNA